uniref:Uncharacterized protein n=1 Tax=Sphaerodactylus townsendi TaxID=933632 RepID=A0ACB8ENE1_9SAUR
MQDREYSQSPTKRYQTPEAEDKARQRCRRSNRPGALQYQGPNVCDGGSPEASPGNRQQPPKTRQLNWHHHCSTKVQGDEDKEGEEGGWRHHREQETIGEGRGDSCKLLSPKPSRKLRSDLVPGPWLVPSKERLSRALWGVCMGQGEEEEQKGDAVRGKGMEVKRRS